MATRTPISTLSPESGTKSPPEDADVRRRLLTSIQGTPIVIPDFQELMDHYPFEVHPEVDRLDDDVEKSLELIFPDPKDQDRLRKMKLARHAFLGASWWPYPSFEALCIATHLGVWLFSWDDEIDSQEYSSMMQDADKSREFRSETIAYIQASLSPNKIPKPSEISTNPLITGFNRIAEAVVDTYDASQTETLLRELKRYIQMTEEEQTLKLKDYIPTIEEYLRCRMGTSAVGPSIAIHEYALGMRIPQDVMQSELMQRIWHETNMIISVTNDVFSLKKEIDQGEVDSLVPLLFLEQGSVQSAVDQATDIVRSSIQRLDAAEQEILERYSSMPALHSEIAEFIKSCKFACTGNLNWR
ncbi:terpenoid synthase [Hypomontagnella monticulosa]|nr:terpenoid synthase [Hypomontagnella monticulosa]